MKVASALVDGRQADPGLAAEAVRQALAAAGLERADHVILFLTHDHQRHAQAAIIAAGRAAGSLQIFGGTVSGIFTERGVLLDRPGAAALVIADASGEGDGPRVAISGHSTLPFDWRSKPARAGLLDSEARTWTHGRLNNDACCEFALPGQRQRSILSPGLKPLGTRQRVDLCEAYELREVGGQSAVAGLRRNLPAELREHLPLHQMAILRSPDEPAIAILSANADGSLTLAEMLQAGDEISWAVRQPLAAEREIRQALTEFEGTVDYALMFSCIGRGPLFYGGEDRDRLAFCEAYPGIPLIGAYGNGQIVPGSNGNRLFHNSVLTLLIEDSHV